MQGISPPEVPLFFNRRRLRRTQSCARLDLSTHPCQGIASRLGFASGDIRAMSKIAVFCAFGLVARRQMRIGRGLCDTVRTSAISAIRTGETGMVTAVFRREPRPIPKCRRAAKALAARDDYTPLRSGRRHFESGATLRVAKRPAVPQNIRNNVHYRQKTARASANHTDPTSCRVNADCQPPSLRRQDQVSDATSFATAFSVRPVVQAPARGPARQRIWFRPTADKSSKGPSFERKPVTQPSAITRIL